MNNTTNQILRKSQEWENFKEALISFKEALIRWAKAFWEKLKDTMTRVAQAFKKLIMLNKAFKENPKLAKLARSKKKRVAKKNIRRLWKIAERGSRG